MGQQQLLLLVISVIIVGIATVAAFETMQVKQRQFAADNLLNRSLDIATHAVQWKTKNDPFRMGDAHYTHLGTNGLGMMGLATSVGEGQYEITRATADSLVITAVSTRYPTLGVRVTVVNYDITRTDVNHADEINLSGGSQ